jgi:hypothetical protein
MGNYEDWKELIKELEKKEIKSVSWEPRFLTKEGYEAFDKTVKEYW